MSEDSEHEPAWMLKENDEKHQQEVAPLLGSGDLPLEDPPKPKQDEEEGTASTYGATSTQDAMAEAEATQLSRSAVRAVISKDPSLLKPHAPSQNPCLWLFHFLEGIVVLSALCLLATQVIPIIIGIRTSNHDQLGVLNLALKVYISLFCFVFILVEANLKVPFVKDSTLLQGYFSRGFIYSFVGLICVEEAYSERVKDLVSHGKDEFHVGWTAIFMQISSWFMLGVGALYMVLGIFCMKGLRDRMHQKEKDDWKQYREDLKVWNSKHRDDA